MNLIEVEVGKFDAAALHGVHHRVKKTLKTRFGGPYIWFASVSHSKDESCSRAASQDEAHDISQIHATSGQC